MNNVGVVQDVLGQVLQAFLYKITFINTNKIGIVVQVLLGQWGRTSYHIVQASPPTVNNVNLSSWKLHHQNSGCSASLSTMNHASTRVPYPQWKRIIEIQNNAASWAHLPCSIAYLINASGKCTIFPCNKPNNSLSHSWRMCCGSNTTFSAVIDIKSNSTMIKTPQLWP